MKKFDVIMFNMSNYSEWDEGVSNRNYHVLKQLSKRPEIGKILAVDYLPLNPKRALRIYKEDLVLNIDGAKLVKRGLLHKVTKVSSNVYVYSDINFFLKPQETIKNIKKIALELNFGDIVTWSFFPFMAPYWRELGQKLIVFDAVDNWLLHSSYKKYEDKLKKAYETVKTEADLIFAVSKNLLHFFDDQQNVYWIPNGVDFKHYNKSFPLVNRDIADIPKPIIGYVGVMQNKVDFELVKYLAKNNPQKSIVLVGPVWNEQDANKLALEKELNVYFLGYKKYEEAPMYIQQFDIGIVPHVTAGFAASTNPMKIYEYLACGKPVVSTENIGTENLNDMIASSNDYKIFNDNINKLLIEDNPDLQKKRQDFAKKHSWFNMVNKMLELVDNRLN